MAQLQYLEDNKLFRWADQLPEALWQDLASRDPEDAALATGADWDGERFTLPLLGRENIIDPGARSVELAGDFQDKVSYQAGMVALYTLAQAQPAPPSGQMITPQELTGGSLFFTGPHSLRKKELRDTYGQNPAGLVERALAMGGEQIEGADAAVRLPALPMMPLYVLLWAGDEEFPTRVVWGIDSRALFHLALDGVWALTNLACYQLVGR